MREKSLKLKQIREKDERQYANDVVEKQWIRDCNELRTVQSKVNCYHVQVERQKTYNEDKLKKDEMKQRNKQFYDKLWKNDIRMKENNEQNEKLKKLKLKHDICSVLTQQIKEREKRKMDIQIEKSKEYQDLMNLQEQIKLEKENEFNKKLKKYHNSKKFFENSLKMRNKHTQYIKNEQLKYDQALLQKLEKEESDEKRASIHSKKRRNYENLIYMDYLNKINNKEQSRLVKVDKMCDEIMNEDLVKRKERSVLEYGRQRKLIDAIKNSRKQQVDEKLELIKKRKEEECQEVNQFLNILKKQNELFNVKEAVKSRRNREYQLDLLAQIEFNKKIKESKLLQQKEIYRRQVDADELYKTKIENTLKLDAFKI
ncbi:Coiled-coil domain-containing protein 11 [Intoshia linei]|uniref:Cilia- and flagella-associated protein 53 n=1 Tax=Intoshia linei TaxID=1819745 RepID=A0A177BDA0_9BILA|nr:Coiled-coil domain-containing protein 11 [Intoshia linei]